jgi:SUZ domain
MDRVSSSENQPVVALSSDVVAANAPVVVSDTVESRTADVANVVGSISASDGATINSRDESFSHYDRKSYHFENSVASNPKIYVRSHSTGPPVTHRSTYMNNPMDPNQLYYDMNQYLPPSYHGSQVYNNINHSNQYAAPMRRRPSPTYTHHNSMYYPQNKYSHGLASQQPYPQSLNGYAAQQPMPYEPKTAKYSYNHQQETSHRNMTPPTNSNVDSASTVDSALLSALLNDDMEECWALLRLEQILIEFVQNTTTGWMEVGGPYNSVILYASSSTSSENPTATEANDSRNYRSPSAETSNQVDSNNTHEMSNPRISQPPPPPQYHYQQQTTFQRCVLHRLADRFNIIREPGRSSCHTSNMLRLIKMPNTCIPKMSLAEYYHKCIVPSQSNEKVGEGIGDPTEGLLASMSLSEGDPEGLDPPTQQPLKIMKRASSHSSAGKPMDQGVKKSASSTASTLDSNYEDKERAYAEARARIFQDNERTMMTADAENNVSNNDPDQRWTMEESAVDPQSKAVYRNRYQEVADPDFQRFHPSRRNMHPPPYPMHPGGTPYMNAPEFPGVWAVPPPYHLYPPVAPPSFADHGAYPPLPPPHPEEGLERVASAPAKLKAAAPEFVPRWQQP